MKVKWTEEQKDAIYMKDSNILVAAAAGSGKTAVLVERIINKIINEKIDINHILVVTFTNAAAAEMRERILDAIYKKMEEQPENVELQRQITLLNKSSICTIDSFCLEIVRNNFFELENISPNFRIADTTEIELLKQETIEDIFEKKYEKQDEDFTKLINTYTSYRDDIPLKELILKIYEYIQSNPFPEKWLKEKVEMFNLKDRIKRDFAETIWGENLIKEIKEELIDDISTLQEVEKNLSYEPDLENFCQTIRNDIEMMMDLKNNLNSWDKAYEIYQNFKFATWPRKKVESKIKEQAKIVRDDVKKKITSKLNKILICNSEEANSDIYGMYYTLLKLENIILEFSKEFSKRKREKNIVDFHDVEHFALEILLKQDEKGNIEKSKIAKKYQQKYEEIAIDEYQDSNLVQEYILMAISKGKNMFFVGDVKQSIYKFRQAMPELFLNKYEEYKNKEIKKEDENLKIQLFKNFRSRENILKFTNIIFENIMSSSLGDIEYDEQEYLNRGAYYPEIETNQSIQNLKTEINIIDVKKIDNETICEKETEEIENKSAEEKENTKNVDKVDNTENFIETQYDEEGQENEERIEDIELEARFVANKIKKMINEKFKVWDKKKSEYRNIQYKDIVILLRATSTSAPIYEQELLNLEIPVFSDSSQEYLDSIEIQTIISLLKIIDNPIQDIPLVTVLRSSIGKFTDDELIQIRLSDKYENFYTCLKKAKIDVDKQLRRKIDIFLNNLNNWRKEQEYLALDELIWKIYSDTGFYNYVGLMPNGELRQANLRMLFEKAKQYETASFKGLYNFIKFIEKLALTSGDMNAAKVIGENDNVVRIMSIHKSKGLEFPVVFLSNTGKQFNLMDLNKNILLHQDMGIGVKYIDYEKQVQYDTLTKSAMRYKILTETLSEEMRILYVALTRAKEKLIITGIEKEYQKNTEKMLQQITKYEKSNKKINPILIKKYKKYLDWIKLVYFYNKNDLKDIVEYKVFDKAQIIKTFEETKKEKINVINILNNKDIEKDKIRKLEKELDYEYKHKLATNIPTKTSVTKIKQMENNNITRYTVQENEEIIVENRKINENEEFMKEQEDLNILFPKPNFIKENKEEKITNAQKGTLLHLCMQKLKENQMYNLEKITNMIEKMVQKEIITPKEAENINKYKILKFTKSQIWQDLKNAKEIHKEKPFYINIPAKELYKEDLNEKILVQGIIDLYYIDKDDNLVLLDYKTDYVEEGKEFLLIEKYKKQLKLYKRALEGALNKKVDKVYIYSFYLEKEILIENV